MCSIRVLFYTIIIFLLFIDNTKQWHVRSALTVFRVIKTTIKGPYIRNIRNTIKKPIATTFGNTIKNSVGMFRRNKNAIKNFAHGVQRKDLKRKHNFTSKSIGYLGVEGIKRFKHMAPQASRRGQQLVGTQYTNNNQMKSTAWMNAKGFGLLISRSVQQIRGEETRMFFNMITKSRAQLPFLFMTGSLNRITSLNLCDDINEEFTGTNLYVSRGYEPLDIVKKNPGSEESFEDYRKQNIEIKKNKEALETIYKKKQEELKKQEKLEEKEELQEKEAPEKNKEDNKEVVEENKEDGKEVLEQKKENVKEVIIKDKEEIKEVVVKSKEDVKDVADPNIEGVKEVIDVKKNTIKKVAAAKKDIITKVVDAKKDIVKKVAVTDKDIIKKVVDIKKEVIINKVVDIKKEVIKEVVVKPKIMIKENLLSRLKKEEEIKEEEVKKAEELKKAEAAKKVYKRRTVKKVTKKAKEAAQEKARLLEEEMLKKSKVDVKRGVRRDRRPVKKVITQNFLDDEELNEKVEESSEEVKEELTEEEGLGEFSDSHSVPLSGVPYTGTKGNLKKRYRPFKYKEKLKKWGGKSERRGTE